MKRKIKMKTKKEAVCGASRTAGERKNYRKLFYQQDHKLSSLKEQIGQLLLYLQISPESDRRVYWQRFETSLRKYINLKLNEVVVG